MKHNKEENIMLNKTIGISTFLFLLTGCLYYPPANYNYRDSYKKHIETYTVENKWQPDEQLYVETCVGRSCYISSNDVIRYRKGTTPRGSEYKIYKDGSARLEQWEISCKNDTMTDKRSCSIVSSENRLFIFIEKSKVSHICILGHDFPYRKGAIRMGKDKPITTDYEGCISGNHIKKLYSAQDISLRYYKWPYDYSKDESSTIYRLKEAVDLSLFIYKNGNKLEF